MTSVAQSAVKDMGGKGEALLFAHANGYPPGSYLQLFERLAPRFSIRAIEQRPLWGEREPPRRLRWELFADDLLEVMQGLGAQPRWVMGHSMGATIATLAASRRPELFKGVILLDPVFLAQRFIWTTRLLPQRQLRKMPMIQKALKRPEYFASLEEAFGFYRKKRAFQRFDDAALRDYVKASKEPTDDARVRLRYSGAWEAAVYGSAPSVKGALQRMRVNTLGLRGSHSDTLRPQVWERWQHWQPGARFAEVPGGHLFPLENPQATAQAVLDFVFPQ